MARKGSPRSRGPKRAYWCYDDVADGKERRGWIASDLFVIGCHRTNAHRPCLREMPGLRTACPGCARKIDVEDMGYQAVFRDDGYPVLLVLLEHAHEEVSRMKFGSPIRWSRRGGVGEPVAVYQRLDGPQWTTTLPERQQAADLVPFLAHLWGMDEVLPHLRLFFDRSDTTVSLPLDALPAPVTEGPIRDTAKVIAAGKLPDTVGATSDTLVARFRARAARAEPSTNGKHKPE